MGLYAFQLAQAFSKFYHELPVLTESDSEKKTFLLWMNVYFRSQLQWTLDVLGIRVPEYCHGGIRRIRQAKIAHP